MSADPILRRLGLDFPQLSDPMRSGISWYCFTQQINLPLCAGFYALQKKDYEGFTVLCGATLVNQIFIDVLKGMTGEIRPNKLQGSFPSGDTAAAFLGCSFLIFRYGFSQIPKPIALSMVIATTVGISRILLKMHWTQDVIGGAVLGCSVMYTCLALSKKFNLPITFPDRVRKTLDRIQWPQQLVVSALVGGGVFFLCRVISKTVNHFFK